MGIEILSDEPVIPFFIGRRVTGSNLQPRAYLVAPDDPKLHEVCSLPASEPSHQKMVGVGRPCVPGAAHRRDLYRDRWIADRRRRGSPNFQNILAQELPKRPTAAELFSCSFKRQFVLIYLLENSGGREE